MDPLGLKIVLTSDATYEQKQEYERAITYLKKSATAKALIEKLENAEEVYTIVFENDATSFSSFDSKTNEITWAYLGGIVLNDGSSVMQSGPCLFLQLFDCEF